MAAVGLAIASFWVFVTSKGIAARRRPVKMGPQSLVGAEGEVRLDGLVFVDGELWRAHASDGSQLLAGERVEVQARNGLELTVAPFRGSATAAHEPSTHH